jgi:myxalamid-type polyketide synthase MxaB
MNERKGLGANPAAALSPVKRALLALEEMQAKLDRNERGKSEPIAVVGMACRLPGGADTPERLWEILRDGVDTVTEVPAGRWDADAFYDPDPDAAGKMYSKAGAFLQEKIDEFDAAFFGIAPREAAAMDPQQRLLLEVAWEALERAGYASEACRPAQASVFTGISTYDYAQLLSRHGSYGDIGPYSGTGTLLSVAAGRIAYLLGIHGPTLTLDTACSSSLVALHLACQSLRLGECDLALAGGVNLMLTPGTTIAVARMRALSLKGRCRAFDASADGYVRGEGCAFLVLRRLSDALNDRDQVLALIRGSAVNHDGRSGGLTAPSGSAQEAVIREALANARVAPGDVSYVEAHGTGTPLGDPIEANALRAALGEGRQKPFFLGSAKTNFGHLEAAAGALALLKVVLSLQHREIPKHLHFNNPSTYVDWENLPAIIPSQISRWEVNGRPRIAGVSSFGISGTNAHVIVEEAPPPTAPQAAEPDRPRHLIALSATSKTALTRLSSRFAEHLASSTDSLADICYSANVGRTHLKARLAVAGATPEELTAALSSASMSDGPQESKLAFLFTGQGSQYSGMASSLYHCHPDFRRTIDRCAEIWNRRLDRPLLSVIFDPDCAAILDQTQYTQPALFAIGFALAEMWRSWGIEPQALLGHSVGEYVAAAVAGALSPEDALELLIVRARLMQDLPAGGLMAAVGAPESVVAAHIEPYRDKVSIAAINSPSETVISGEATAVRAVVVKLESAGIVHRVLRTSHAFHSPLIEPILERLTDAASRIRMTPASLPLVSNLTGDFADAALLASREYWASHARSPVRFADGIRALARDGFNAFLEIGPTATLVSLGRRTLDGSSYSWLASLQKGKDDWTQILQALASLYTAGHDVGWSKFDEPYGRRRVALPTYPFERSRHWLNLSRREDRARPASLLGRRLVSPALESVVYETELSTEGSPLIHGHRIRGMAVVPAAVYVEMACLAAAELFGENRGTLEELAIEEALIVPDGSAVSVQFILAPAEPHEFQILSKGAGAQNETGIWRTHARGRLKRCAVGEASQAPQISVAEKVKAHAAAEVSIDAFYDAFASRGMDYGGPFRCVSQLWTGATQAYGLIELPEDSTTDGHKLHPALVDGCFQGFGALLAPDEDSTTSLYLPVRIERIDWLGTLPDRIWCLLERRPEGSCPPGQFVSDLIITDHGGSVLARLQGLTLYEVRAPSGRQKSEPKDLLYRVEWEPQSVAPKRPLPESGAWLLAGTPGDLLSRLAGLLRSAGQKCEIMDAANADVGSVAGLRAWQGVIALFETEGGSYSRCSQTALQLTQALAGKALPGRLWLLTRGAQWVENLGSEGALGASGLWGLGRVIELENPELGCVCVDLDPAAPPDEAARFFEELESSSREDQIAFRGGKRLVPRLVRLRPPPEDSGDQALRLQIRSRGALSQLVVAPVPRHPPGPRQVEIRVHATGLNFRDVLNALGMYPGDPGPLGLECSGTITRVGGAVTDFSVGDEVIAFTQGSFCDYVVCDAQRVIRKGSLSFEQAATISIAFLTAYHALHNLAKVAPGERVLIHAAAGGVGMAAAQLALRAGAEVFGTAGTEEKRSRLTDLGVHHVMNSRTLDFGEEVMRQTNGRGVDIALNSLVGEYITRTMSVLAPNGRFVEIGKIELWDQAKVAAFRKDIAYLFFDIGEVASGDPNLVQAMLQAVLAELTEGHLQPLPYVAFSIGEAEQAFRFMAQSKHIGKIVVLQKPPVRRQTLPIRGESTYLVTGGFGGLGLRVARWLIDQGARHLALASRGAESRPEAADAVRDLEHRGARVFVERLDVSKPGDVRKLFERIDRGMPPLRGIVHAAGVLDDGALQEQSWRRFASVAEPKVDGTWNLHQATLDRPLDFFVGFSSVASVLGSAGQANYASANAAMDAILNFRASRGLPALSINWGPWAEAGMAADAASAAQQRWRRQGVELLSVERGLQTLDQALRSTEESQLIAIDAAWPKLLRQFPAGTEPPFLSRLAPCSPTKSSGKQATREAARRILSATAEDRQRLVTDYIFQEVVRVLGLQTLETVDHTTPLRDLGFDSLMAIELSYSITSLVGRRLSPGKLLETPTVADIAKAVTEEISKRLSS